jgi:hypothetical protein
VGRDHNGIEISNKREDGSSGCHFFVQFMAENYGYFSLSGEKTPFTEEYPEKMIDVQCSYNSNSPIACEQLVA